MRFTAVFFIYFGSLILNCFAQERAVLIKGTIIDPNGTPLTNATISISTTEGIIRKHFGTGNSSEFSVLIKGGRNDSLIIRASSLGYDTKEASVDIRGKDTVQVKLILPFKSTSLNEVVVKAPPIWVRGDTTFFSASAFREGDEKKLRDLLLKMPGFEINEQGQVLYKRKPIEKITVEGEELFADKLSMMVNSFPSHVIDRIEAIENQSENRLLKGLSGEKRTFLNLTLNKSKLQVAFGDAETGLGTRGRYTLAPVLFSLLSTNKLGFVGNWNSMGEGQAYERFREFKLAEENELDPLLMENRSLQLINNFDNRLYLKNRQFDNRLQWNRSLPGRIKGETELSFISDRMRQTTLSELALYTNNSYENRNDTNRQVYKPMVGSVRQTFRIQKDSLQEIRIMLRAGLDHSESRQLSGFYYLGEAQKLDSRIRDRWSSYTGDMQYTKRLSALRADTWNLGINRQYADQKGRGESEQFPEIFQVSDPGMRVLSHELNYRFDRLKAGWAGLRKNEQGRITNFGVDYQYTALNTGRSILLGSVVPGEDGQMPVSIPDPGRLRDHSVVGNFTRGFKLIAKEYAFLDLSGGISNLHAASGNVQTDPVFRINVHSQNTFAFMTSRLAVSFEQKRSDWTSLMDGYYPVSINTLRQSINPQALEKLLQSSYGLSWKWDGLSSAGSILFKYDRQFNNPILENEYDHFMQYTTARMSGTGTNRWAIYSSHQIPSLLLNTLFELSLSYSVSEHLMNIGSGVRRIPFSFGSAYLAIKKNWNRKYFLRGTTHYVHMSNGIQKFIPTSIASGSGNLNLSLYQRLVLNEVLSFSSTTSFYRRNLSTPNVSELLLADLELTVKPRKKNFYWSVKMDNILNEKNYYNFLNGGQVQGFNTIPLIGRAVYSSLTFNF